MSATLRTGIRELWGRWRARALMVESANGPVDVLYADIERID